MEVGEGRVDIGVGSDTKQHRRGVRRKICNSVELKVILHAESDRVRGCHVV